MKFLIIGLGSMGKRRIRNLQFLKAGEIIGIDLREDRRKEVEEKYSIRTFADFDEAMKENPDVLIISTPPDLHTKYALIAAKNNKHFFTEASVVCDGMDELIQICKNKNIISAPSCTMRFHPTIKKIKELANNGGIGKPLAFIYHSGQYLPDWHPWEDYRKFYVSKRATGAAREIVPFELTWLTWAFGGIKKISCFKDKLSDLEADIDDTYQIILKFENNILGHMMIDVISRVSDRSLKIFCENGVIFWEWGKSIKVYNAKNKKWTEHKEKKGTIVKGYDEKIKEEPYIEEMETFLDAVKGKINYPYSLEDDENILKVLEASEKSSDKGKHKSI